MKHSKIRIATILFIQTLVLTSLLSTSALAKNDSNKQSGALPFGLEIVNKVRLAGSDATSADFQAKHLPALSSAINSNLGNRGSIPGISSMALDPSKLQLTTAVDARVYFVGEGSKYHNTLGFNTEGGGVTTGNPKLIFPDASSSVSSYDPAKKVKRTGSNPLAPGDFVDLGTIEGGQQLDFFLISDGARGGRTVFSTDSSINPDGINHAVAFALQDSPYLLIGFQDASGGGDRGYNDLLFAVDIGNANVSSLPGVPEPATWCVLFSFLAIGLYLQHRHQQRTPRQR